MLRAEGVPRLSLGLSPLHQLEEEGEFTHCKEVGVHMCGGDSHAGGGRRRAGGLCMVTHWK